MNYPRWNPTKLDENALCTLTAAGTQDTMDKYTEGNSSAEDLTHLTMRLLHCACEVDSRKLHANDALVDALQPISG